MNYNCTSMRHFKKLNTAKSVRTFSHINKEQIFDSYHYATKFTHPFTGEENLPALNTRELQHFVFFKMVDPFLFESRRVITVLFFTFIRDQILIHPLKNRSYFYSKN